MRKSVAVAGAVLLLAISANSAPPPINEEVPPASNDYAPGPDSLPQPGVPAGKSFKFEMSDSKIFPATVRTITVYVPAEYQADKPACVYVGLDGLGFRVPVVFDNLIAQHAMPVAVAIGVSPGAVNSAKAPQNPRFDRSFEFDSVTDQPCFNWNHPRRIVYCLSPGVVAVWAVKFWTSFTRLTSA